MTTGMTAPGRPKAPAPWLPIWQMRHASPTAVAPSRTCPAHTAVGLSAVPLLDALMSLVHDVCHSGYHRSACRQLGRFWKLWLRRHAVQLALCVIIYAGLLLEACLREFGWLGAVSSCPLDAQPLCRIVCAQRTVTKHCRLRSHVAAAEALHVQLAIGAGLAMGSRTNLQAGPAAEAYIHTHCSLIKGIGIP